MNADDIDRAQAHRLQVALFPGVNFLVRLMKRMETKGFPPADPMYQLVAAAYEWSYRLSMDLHYRSCSGTHQPTPHPSGDKADLTEGVVMKSEIRVKPHAVIPSVNVVEVWHDGQFLATIAGAEGPGVRVITKHAVKAKPAPDDGSGVNVMEIGIAVDG